MTRARPAPWRRSPSSRIARQCRSSCTGSPRMHSKTQATMQSILLRHDEPALRRQAREILERGGSVHDWDIIDLLADGGLHQEALEPVSYTHLTLPTSDLV